MASLDSFWKWFTFLSLQSSPSTDSLETSGSEKCSSPVGKPVPNDSDCTASDSQTSPYTLAEVLAIARIHPFYTDHRYPPEDDIIRVARQGASRSVAAPNLSQQPLLSKKSLYEVIERLVNDLSPENAYRHNVYTSVTGGGSTNSKPLFFATDAMENRRQRAYHGQFLRTLGVVERGDWVLTTHTFGHLYRSLDLTCETMENAGASVLAAGNYMTAEQVAQLLQDFSVNILMGDANQVVSVIHHISTMTKGRGNIKLDKIIYTSEGLIAAQKEHIHEILGPVKIYSVLGSAEAGPYGVSSPDLTPDHAGEDYADFVVDTRTMLVEVFPLSYVEGDPLPDNVPDGETGIIAQTSLMRLRNPVVRYLTGDIGSLHALPEKAKALIAEADRPFMRILRLNGRDRRFSFLWDGYDIEFEKLSVVMAEPQLRVLQWQVILDKLEPSKEVALELRVLGAAPGKSETVVVDRLRDFFWIYSSNEHKFRVTFVSGVSGFELSQTGRKVVKFVDRRD
ncbi:hypothetical protein C8034_v006343 [Colletotrichum sidae]|uniref:Phenylacetate-coenzyme A ligase n=1 Tax=Colletotrichum sidae TaxID=1347389 RepID=A0A4R8TTH2_9PEZI|nr:hypothetical protein C8034_v006343 [Colletotrichum sidae]